MQAWSVGYEVKEARMDKVGWDAEVVGCLEKVSKVAPSVAFRV